VDKIFRHLEGFIIGEVPRQMSARIARWSFPHTAFVELVSAFKITSTFGD